MFFWIADNLATIIVALVILIIVLLVIRSIYRNKKAGRSCSCGSGCSGCAGSEICHQKPDQKNGN